MCCGLERIFPSSDTQSWVHRKKRRAVSKWIILAVLLCSASLSAHGQDDQDAQEEDVFGADIPTGHISLQNPADLSPQEAEELYETVRSGMFKGYSMSGLAATNSVGAWRRFNAAPYRSAQHGERFVNNYANAVGEVYEMYEDAGTFPEGSILAKDSFTVTEKGEVYAGALFLMEKMPEGFDPESRDWKYSMILPDGSVFGISHGEGHEQVEFCVTCHIAAGDEQDHLFFIPEELRR